MDPDSDVPPLLESSEATQTTVLSSHQSFHESSTNVSVADSAAATIGSESFREFSDRGQISSNSSEDEVSEADSYIESSSNKPPSKKEGFNESDMSSDEDWVEEASADEPMHNIKYCTFGYNL